MPVFNNTDGIVTERWMQCNWMATAGVVGLIFLWGDRTCTIEQSGSQAGAALTPHLAPFPPAQVAAIHNHPFKSGSVDRIINLISPNAC